MAIESDAVVVADLGFGDSGKGSIVDYLVRTRDRTTVIRYNGGPQASHNVVTPEGTSHAFHQFGSGTLVPGVATYLSRFVLVSPLLLWREAETLAAKAVASPLTRITIDRDCKIITPYHEAANRLRESARGADRHGSCGLGIGETMADSLAHPDETLTAGDLRDRRKSRIIIEAVRRRKLAELGRGKPDLAHSDVAACLETLHDERLSDAVADFYARSFAPNVRIAEPDGLGDILRRGNVIFEGAQGVLLDEQFGFHPYTTWSTTTVGNAEALLAEHGFEGSVMRLGLVRTYMTRHGAGPFVTEDAGLTSEVPDPANPANQWQGRFRVGHFDCVAARYALRVAGRIDALAVSHLDQLVGRRDWPVCTGYVDEYGRTLTDLPSAESPSLAQREALTRHLLRSRSRLEPSIDGPIGRRESQCFAAYIHRTLARPVAVESWGPTYRDKVVA